MAQVRALGRTGDPQGEEYARRHEFRNLDHLLEYLIFESPSAALVIIDEIPEKLEDVLATKFQFGVEVLELACYENAAGECIYRFKPFLADVGEDVPPLEVTDVDTVVVPAGAERAQEVFLDENRWYTTRMRSTHRR